MVNRRGLWPPHFHLSFSSFFVQFFFSQGSKYILEVAFKQGKSRKKGFSSQIAGVWSRSIVHTNHCGNCYERLESMYVVMFNQESPTGYSLPKAVEARMLHHGQIVVNYLQNWNATKTHQSWHDIEAQNMMFSYWTACMIRKGINLC